MLRRAGRRRPPRPGSNPTDTLDAPARRPRVTRARAWLMALVCLAAVACGSSEDCASGENRICDGVDNCLCGPRCSDDSDCAPNQNCAENLSGARACVAITWQNGNAPECLSGQIATEALCGGDQCSCADPCSVDEDCASLCCAGGACALPCVCETSPPVEVITCGGS